MKTLPGKLPPSKDLIIEYALGIQSRHSSPKANQWANLGIRDCVPLWLLLLWQGERKSFKNNRF